jgi:hypothetical protein
MARQRKRLETQLDLIIPVGAVLLIGFSLGSIWFSGGFQVSARAPHHVLKTAYRAAPTADIPLTPM